MIRQACCANRSPHWTTVTNIHLQAFTIGRQQHWRQVFSCGTIQQSYKERHRVEVPTFDNDFCKPLAGAEQNHGLCWLHECFVLPRPQLKRLPGHPLGVSRCDMFLSNHPVHLWVFHGPPSDLQSCQNIFKLGWSDYLPDTNLAQIFWIKSDSTESQCM